MPIALARRTAAWLVEDDYDSEYRYSRPPIPSPHSLDSAGRVIYVGSMSNVLFPSLRIGYLVLPPALVDRFAGLRSVVDDHGPLVDQAMRSGVPFRPRVRLHRVRAGRPAPRGESPGERDEAGVKADFAC